jgi:hypothetical protein
VLESTFHGILYLIHVSFESTNHYKIRGLRVAFVD